MSNKKYLYIAGVLILAIFILCFVFYPREKVLAPSTTNTQIPTEKITYQNASADLIVIDSPKPDAVVSKEFSITGKARGQWFFEASFPIEVLDSQSKIIATGIAQAQSEWTTADFVPFIANIKISGSYSGPATLVLKKDNPSGLPDKDASASFPITI